MWSTRPGLARTLKALLFGLAPPDSAHAAFRTLSSAEQSELIRFLQEMDGAELPAPIPNPIILVRRSGGLVSLRWPAAALGFSLYSSPELGPSATWNHVTNTPEAEGEMLVVELPADPRGKFFRLQKP